jgi:CRISPR/Cas system-associated endonuclease Cas3-HD
MMPAPPGAYEALELYKGLKEEGRIVNYPLAFMTYQMTVHKDRFPDTFGRNLRNLVVEKFDEAKKRLIKLREKIPDKYWMDLPEENLDKYRRMFREVRQKLKKRDVYDVRMMQLLRNIRCRSNPSLAECTM